MLKLSLMQDKRIFTVILNFQSGKFLLKCVGSVLKTDSLPLEIIVVDNASTDESVRMVETQFRKVKIIRNVKNLGFAGGNNVGIRYALKNNADYIFLLNPDATIETNTISNLLETMEKGGQSGIVGPKICSPDGKIWSCGGKVDIKRFTAGLIGFGEKDRAQYNNKKEADFISGTAMFIAREVFEKIGFLTEDYFLYYEDVDFCMRAKKSGFKLYFSPHSVVYHDWSFVVGRKSPQKDYFMARNHLLFLERHAPFFVKFRELLRLPKTICEHCRKGEKFALLGIKDYFLRRFGEYDYWS